MEFVFTLIERIEKNYGVYIGKKSLHDLATFISGVEYTLCEVTRQRVCFDSAFQRYIEGVFGETNYGGKHWDKIVLENKTEEEAFDSFFVYYRMFKHLTVKEN